MPCFKPMPGWYAKRVNESGKRSIVFRLDDGFKDRPLSVPCGTCLGCRLEKARQWAVRCMHEAALYDVNSFVTLTYDDEHISKDGSLVPAHMVKFLKRLRWHRSKVYKLGPRKRLRVYDDVRFFQCGEYGEKLSRPHHHAILFNVDFPDKVALAGKDGLYRSDELAELWPHGFSSIGAVTFESAGYVARYAMKKVIGSAADLHYSGKVPEYLTMSRRPGVGRRWIEKYHRDVYPSDELVVNGVACKPPRYYDNVVETLDKCALSAVKLRRRDAAAADPDNTGKRLGVREVIKEAAITTLTRGLEDL